MTFAGSEVKGPDVDDSARVTLEESVAVSCDVDNSAAVTLGKSVENVGNVGDWEAVTLEESMVVSCDVDNSAAVTLGTSVGDVCGVADPATVVFGWFVVDGVATFNDVETKRIKYHGFDLTTKHFTIQYSFIVSV